MTPSPTTPKLAGSDASAAVAAEIDASGRVPLLVLFISAAIWLVIASGLALIGTLKFHQPALLADCACFTYGRVHPASFNAAIYGFCLPAGFGVGLWLLARLGRAPLAMPLIVTVGAMLWNLGVTLGVLGILDGDSTGFENLELPGYAGALLFLGYLPIGLASALTFHARRERQLAPAQWFLVAALFWFPWIFSSAELLLNTFPSRGVAQPILAWWYSNNLLVVWCGLAGLAAMFHFVPTLLQRESGDKHLPSFIFWLLILVGSWGGIPATAPVPAWMPAISTVAGVMMIIPILAVLIHLHRTLEGRYLKLMSSPSLQFIGFGVASLFVGGSMNLLGAFPRVSAATNLTWFSVARVEVEFYGFFSMIMFGAIYQIVPRILGMEFTSPKMVSAHFWCAAIGAAIIAVSLSLGGLAEGMRLQNPEIPFLDVMKGALMFLRMSTLGDLLIAFGHLLFILNLAGLALRYYRAQAQAVRAEVTADLFKTEGARS